MNTYLGAALLILFTTNIVCDIIRYRAYRARKKAEKEAMKELDVQLGRMKAAFMDLVAEEDHRTLH